MSSRTSEAARLEAQAKKLRRQEAAFWSEVYDRREEVVDYLLRQTTCTEVSDTSVQESFLDQLRLIRDRQVTQGEAVRPGGVATQGGPPGGRTEEGCAATLRSELCSVEQPRNGG